ncbi:DEAD/DEAH box helicase [Caulobacter flavus]|uniref:Transcription-repair-coupling factor n=1 Tax=Caulobacter flavus TaxID=1679497 RepID=A0A2N5CP33_9CAUL|nr:DEAD/DEAH box helicase [Caulobacter flavus]AYV48588.1 DEAD/DEAH box helicase [Caulobacter flavus]PLR08696.1 DEAD/DEAH box helicase [Caulobacter flavus]
MSQSELSPTSPVGETLTPGAAASPRRTPSSQPPAAAVAAALAATPATGVVVHLASSDRRADEIGRALTAFAAERPVLVLPPWDCLPYDRASPSRDVMGRRARVVASLADGARAGAIVVTSPEALVQRLPPGHVVAEAVMTLRTGDPLDRDALARFAARTGYVTDERIDEPGEIALLGEVVDVFPPDAAKPARIVVEETGVIAEIRIYDPLTQRSEIEVDSVSLGPASEWILPEAAAPEEPPETWPQRPPGVEHGLADHYDDLTSLFDLLPDAKLSVDPKAPDRLPEVEDHVLDAHAAHLALGGKAEPTPSPPAALYLLGDDLRAAIKRWKALALPLDGVEAVASFAGGRSPGRAFSDFVEAQQAAGRRVVLTGLRHELRPLTKALARGLDLKPQPADGWYAARSAEPGAVSSLEADLEAGFVDPDAALAVVAAADVLGGRMASRASSATDLVLEPDLRIGDVVLHEDHGVGVLRDLSTVEIEGVARDVLHLEYYGGDNLLAPVEEIGRIWRYGGEAAGVTLDRLKGEAWARRRAEVSRHVDDAARRLVALATERQARTCEPIVPPKVAYARFAARFAYPETPDQAAAIEAVLGDLASGRPMDRLVCGDVGYGKTEVALRAAAAVALSGRQVALAAPTTVLARQHVETFRRRFQGTGIGVAHLSRLVTPAEARAVRQGLDSGEIKIVVGTQALAGKDMAFDDLALLIIDEEQKFGAALKAQLRGLCADGHVLTLTATPIPRTLQAAMVGIQDVSVIASPPARRRPVRTFVAPFDAASLRTALMREKRRGGQSFLVVPRIDDVGPIGERLAKVVPELSVRVAHGDVASDAMDAVMVGFADGDGDVLLATNIIESGLDVPRANTMIVWRPDRFGLSQLHQLRGRVGRGRIQGVACLLTDPDSELSEATRARLSTLEAFDRLGSGLAISARDLDLRGGGDLVGEDQAGHVKMIGASLYQRLLARAVAVARGEADADAQTPNLVLGEIGSLPPDYVPDPVVRIGLYARLARIDDPAAIDAFEEELEDRFGSPPDAVGILLAKARLTALARAAGVVEVRAGPKGVVLVVPPKVAAEAAKRLTRVVPEVSVDGGRIIVASPSEDDTTGRTLVERLVSALAAGR